MSGSSLGRVLGALPCFATSFDAGADVGREFTFFACKATCRRAASLCRAVAVFGAVARASGGFHTSEYLPAPKAVGASTAVNNASPSLRTISPRLVASRMISFTCIRQSKAADSLTQRRELAERRLTLTLNRRNF
jgi:hypothetical protein